MQVCKEEKLLCSFYGQGKQCQTVIASINNEWQQQMACQSEFRKWCPNILQNFSSIINPILKWPGSFWVAFHLFYWNFFLFKRSVFAFYIKSKCFLFFPLTQCAILLSVWWHYWHKQQHPTVGFSLAQIFCF